jgi:putative sterol carrier protein
MKRATSRHEEQSPTAAFFDDLADRGREPLLKSASGTLRFDMMDGDRVEHWRVRIDDGDVTVSRNKSRADAVVRLDKAMSDGLVTGRVNAMAAVLRGDLVPDGDLSLLLLFQRLFPGPQ